MRVLILYSSKDEKQFYDAVRAILGEDGGL